MEAGAVTARLFEGLGDQAAILLVDALHQRRQVDGAIAIGEAEDRMDILACEEMSCLYVDAPEAEEAIGCIWTMSASVMPMWGRD